MLSDRSVISLTQVLPTRHQVVLFPCNRKFNSHSEMSGVQVFSAPNILSQSSEFIAKHFHSVSRNQNKFWYRTMIGLSFFFVRACVAFLSLKFASKSRTFPIILFTKNDFHNCTLKTRLSLHSLLALRPSFNTDSSVTYYTVHKQTGLNSRTQKRRRKRHNKRPKLRRSRGWTLTIITNWKNLIAKEH